MISIITLSPLDRPTRSRSAMQLTTQARRDRVHHLALRIIKRASPHNSMALPLTSIIIRPLHEPIIRNISTTLITTISPTNPVPLLFLLLVRSHPAITIISSRTYQDDILISHATLMSVQLPVSSCDQRHHTNRSITDRNLG